MGFLLQDKTDDELVGYFKEYVESFQCKERHSQAACDEVAQYDKLVSYFFPKELKPQTKLYDKMMDVAVEFEESGFMAGYRMCLKHLQEQEQSLEAKATNSPPEEIKRQTRAVTGPVDALDFISSRQIADIFGTTNFKIVRRINEQILPYCTEDERREFTLSSEMNQQHRYLEVYHLSRDACIRYLDYIEGCRKYTNIAEGIDKFREMIRSAFRDVVPA